MAFRRSCHQAIRFYSSGNKSDEKNVYAAATAGFIAIALLQTKRMYEKQHNCDLGIIALFQGRWGDPFPDANCDNSGGETPTA